MYKKHKNSSLASIYERTVSTLSCLEVTKRAPFYQDFIARSEISGEEAQQASNHSIIAQNPSTNQSSGTTQNKTKLSNKKPVKNTQKKTKKEELPVLPFITPIVHSDWENPLTEKKQTSKKSKK